MLAGWEGLYTSTLRAEGNGVVPSPMARWKMELKEGVEVLHEGAVQKTYERWV